MTKIRLQISAAALVLATTLHAGTPPVPEAIKPVDPAAQPYSFLDPIESFARDSILQPKAPFELVPGKDPNGWGFVAEPYLWGMGISGDVGVKGFPPTHVDVSAKKLLGYLDWGLMGKGEIRKGRWAIMGDGFFAQMSGISGTPGPLYSSASLKMQQGMATLAVAYRIIDDRRGFLDIYAGARYNYIGCNMGGTVDSSGVQYVSDSVAERIGEGIRVRVKDIISQNANALVSDIASSVKTAMTDKVLLKAADVSHALRSDLDRRQLLKLMENIRSRSGSYQELLVATAAAKSAEAKNQLTADIQNRLTNAQKAFANDLAKRIERALPTSVAGSEWWVDPIVGLRGQINFTRWLFLAAQGDVGGFGAGSQIAWNAQASLGVNFTRNVFGELGYRYFYMDYSHSGNLYKAAEAGIFAGIGVKF